MNFSGASPLTSITTYPIRNDVSLNRNNFPTSLFTGQGNYPQHEAGYFEKRIASISPTRQISSGSTLRSMSSRPVTVSSPSTVLIRTLSGEYSRMPRWFSIKSWIFPTITILGKSRATSPGISRKSENCCLNFLFNSCQAKKIPSLSQFYAQRRG